MMHFQVWPDGVLSVADYVGPQTRAEIYDIDASAMSSADDILSALDVCPRLSGPLYSAFDEARDKLQRELEGLNSHAADTRRQELLQKLSVLEGDADVTWRAWIKSLSVAEVRDLLLDLQTWLEQVPDPDSDRSDFPLDGIQFAFEIMEQESSEVLELLAIKLIDGPMPGSSFQAASLGISAEEASSIAATHGLPYVFAPATADL